MGKPGTGTSHEGSNGWDPQPDLRIVGKGEQKEALQALARELGIASQVQFLPWMNHNKLAVELAAARLCVLPSRHENYSLALLSALCVGVPTISTKVGGDAGDHHRWPDGTLDRAGRYRGAGRGHAAAAAG